MRYKMASKYTRVSLSGTLDKTGAADVYSDRTIRGKIESVLINYPASTVAITISTDEIVSQKIIELSADNTDRVIYPRVPLQTNAGVDINNSFDNTSLTKLVGHYVVFSRLRLVCSSGSEDEIVKVIVIVEEY
jgi:hypothetical protein